MHSCVKNLPRLKQLSPSGTHLRTQDRDMTCTPCAHQHAHTVQHLQGKEQPTKCAQRMRVEKIANKARRAQCNTFANKDHHHNVTTNPNQNRVVTTVTTAVTLATLPTTALSKGSRSKRPNANRTGDAKKERVQCKRASTTTMT